MADILKPRTAATTKSIPWYFLSMLAFFLIPLSWLLGQIKQINRSALLKACVVITGIGYTWSYLVTSQGWWTFNPLTMLGIEWVPNLPVEEMLFYPLGGFLSIVLYLWLCEKKISLKPLDNRGIGLLVSGTAMAAAAVVFSMLLYEERPWYLVSQLLVFNVLSLILILKNKCRIAAVPVWITIGVMAGIGFFWNWLAFTQGWWAYHATLGWMFPRQVPVDDWNFYVFAPLAAVSLYSHFAAHLKT